MQHLPILSPHELLDATFRERWRRGWAAVAPQLEQYVDQQRWPSGLFLPEDLRNHAARRIRPPPWFPHWGFTVLMIVIGTLFRFVCATLMDISSLDMSEDSPTVCGYGRFPNFACMPCSVFVVCGISMVTLVVYGVLISNKQVQEHVNALYVFYALDHADPSMPPDLMCHFELSRGLHQPKPMQITVFANGECLVLPSSLLGPRLSTIGDAAASSGTEAASQHACRRQQPSSTAAETAQPDVAVQMKPLAGKLRSSSDRKLPDAGDGENAPLVGESAMRPRRG